MPDREKKVHLYSHFGIHSTVCGRRMKPGMKAHIDYQKISCGLCMNTKIVENLERGNWANIFEYAVRVLRYKYSHDGVLLPEEV